MTFQELNLIEPILRAVNQKGYTVPTPIQQKSIPFVLSGKDLIGCAQTGTGKTASFAIPILQRLHQNPLPPNQRKVIRSLILAPTRELAIQIGESFEAYGKLLPLKHTVIFGGVTQGRQTSALKNGVDIVIATPGRLLDLMNQGYVSLAQVQIFVLDEADRMLDMGFIHDIRKIIPKLPQRRQTLLFSATMPPEIQKLADTILRDPVKVAVDPVSSTVDKVNQSVYFVGRSDKKSLLAHLLKNTDIDSALVFSRTKHGANKVVKDLSQVGIRAEAIHGNKSQNARQLALSNFKTGKTRVLVATDIAARGIDINELGHVINYDLPNIPETYVHRIGRTGRAGASGKAISFCDHEEKEYLKDIHKLIGKTVDPIHNHPFAISAEIPQAQARTAHPNPRASVGTQHRRKNNWNRNWGQKNSVGRKES